MAGFFSLGGRGGRLRRSRQNQNQEQDHPEIHPDAAFYWCRNNNPHHPHHHPQWLQDHPYSYAVGHNIDESPPSTSAGPAFMMMSGSTSSSSSISCQDCGNQAKKDCIHMRCRTCCKSRGFDCPTHVKSTWVPASRRRERQQQHQPQQAHLSSQQQQQQRQIQQSKRQRDHQIIDPSTTGAHAYSSGNTELAKFPAEVSSTAVFRCVKVSSIDDGEDQFAYQTAVNIGGHLFKGILYDQGPDHHNNYNIPLGETSSGTGGSTAGGSGRATQQLNFMDAARTTASGATPSSSAQHHHRHAVGGGLYDPNSLYSTTQTNSFNMAGTQFFLPPRS